MDKLNMILTPPLERMIITSPYGMRVHPVTGIQKMHFGVDLLANIGTPGHAARDSEIEQTRNDKTSGIYMILKWENEKGIWRMVYCHLSKIIKNRGIVKAGEEIFLTGNTGASTGPHLHWGFRLNDDWLNPMDYLGTKNG